MCVHGCVGVMNVGTRMVGVLCVSECEGCVCVHGWFVSVYVSGFGVSFCHFWNAIVEELGGIAYVHAFSARGVRYGFGKLGCWRLCVHLGALWLMGCVFYKMWMLQCVYLETVCVGCVCVQEL